MSSETEALARESARMLQSGAFDTVLRQCLSGHLSDDVVFNLTLHENDQMLAHSLAAHQEPWVATSQYLNVALQQYLVVRQLLELSFPDDLPGRCFLDFACGYGRLLRFLSVANTGMQLTACEIQTPALAFIRDTFGVAAFPSAASPEDWKPGRREDFIWCASLFSHLPDGLFQRWLARLHHVLSEEGVLAFSVHDRSMLTPDQQGEMGDSGLYYLPSSEIADLSPEIYGTTFVTESYVRRALADALGPQYKVIRIPRALAHEQDVYLVSASPECDLASFKRFRYGPWGWADLRERRPDGCVEIRGWAADMEGYELAALEVTIGDKFREIVPREPSPRVAEHFARQCFASCGYRVVADPETSESVDVTVLARATNRQRALIYRGRL